MTAEAKVEEFIAVKGMVERWERVRRQNHWFDALYNTCAAGHGCGARLVDEQAPPAPPPPKRDRDEDDDRGSWMRGRPERGSWLNGYKGRR